MSYTVDYTHHFGTGTGAGATASAEGFTGFVPDALRLQQIRTTFADPNDIGGEIDTASTGKNIPKLQSYWYKVITWEDLGVPAGAIVTNMAVSTWTRVLDATTPPTGGLDIGPYEVWDASATTKQFTFWTGRLNQTTIESSYVNSTGSSAVPSGYQPSNTSFHLRLCDTIGTGNSNSSSNGVAVDHLTFTMTYAAPNTSRVIPDAIISSAHLSGTITNVQDDPDSPDANWLTYT